MNITIQGKSIMIDCNESLIGGLGQQTSQTNITCSPLVSKQSHCSYILNNSHCKNLIGKYHTINENSEILQNFLISQGFELRSKNDIINFKNWLLVNDINKIDSTNIRKFWNSFETIVDIILDELNKREDHIKNCVCISDHSHSLRIKTLKEVSELIQRFKMDISYLFCNKDSLPLGVRYLQLYYFVFNYTDHKQKYLNDFIKEVNRTISTNYFNIIINDSGELDKSSTIYQLTIFNKYFTDPFFINNHIQKRLKVNIESLYKNEDMFDTCVSCIKLNKLNEVIAVEMNYDQISDYLYNKYHMKVSQVFLRNYIEENHKTLIYRNCFISMVKHNSYILTQICKDLDKIKMDGDIRDILYKICMAISSQSKSLIKIIVQKELESKIKEIIPRITNVYGKILEERPKYKVFKQSSYKTTGDIIRDFKHLSEETIIDLVIRYEYEWNSNEYTQKLRISV